MREDGDLLLRAVVRTLADKVDEFDEGTQPASFHLEQNYPNPFNDATRIRFTLAKAGESLLRIYDLGGKEIYRKRFYEAGVYEIPWRGLNAAGESLPSGVYLISLRDGKDVQTVKATLLR